MLLFSVYRQPRSNTLPHFDPSPYPAQIEFTHRRNPNKINHLHTLKNHPSHNYNKTIPLHTLWKNRGYTPKPFPEIFTRNKRGPCNAQSCPKQEMPKRVHQCMNNRRRKHRVRLAPGPPIKHSGDRSQNHVPPIRKPHVRNMREPKQNGGDHPADSFVLRSPLQHVLQQPAKQKLFRPGREAKNRQRQERQRLPFTPARTERDEMHRRPKRNRNRSKRDEAPEDIYRPTRSPADVVSRARKLPYQQERRNRDGHAKQHSEHIRQSPARKRPEPVRRRKFHRSPDSGDGDVILPGAR